MSRIHNQKIDFVNAVIRESNDAKQVWEQCKKAMGLLPSEAKDLTEELAEQIVSAMPTRCVGNVVRKTPVFRESPEAIDEHEKALGRKSY